MKFKLTNKLRLLIIYAIQLHNRVGFCRERGGDRFLLASVLRSWDWSVGFALLPSIELGHRTGTTVLEHRIVICAEEGAHLNRVGCYLPIRRGY